MTTKRAFFYGWIILAVGFLTIVGGYICRNTFSVFYPAIVDEFGWTRGNTAIIFSINIMVYGIVAPFAGALADRFRPRYVLAAGAILMGIGMASCSLATAKWQFYLLYGVVAAIGLSVAGWAPVATLIANWFVRRRALAFGILGAGFGLSLIAAYFAQYVISSFGWRTAYVVIGLFIALLVAPICIILVRRTPADKGLFPEGMTAEEYAAEQTRTSEYRAASAWRKKDWTLRSAMRTRQFWLLFVIWIVSMGIVEQIAISHHVYFYLDVGYAPLTAATFFGIFGICFAAGNVVGAISDRIGRERFFIPACLVCAGFVSLYFVMKDTSTPWLPPVIASGFGLSFGSLCCVLNATLADLFQGAHYGRIAGTMIVGFAIGGTVSPWMAGYLHDVTGSYTITFAVLVVALVATAVMMWFVAPRRLNPIRR
ncbi:MAG: MFS transporter [Dehalococcoidia bacterium]|nr:MAG: MFS transporter [Dehalococcoidia bacterium]